MTALQLNKPNEIIARMNNYMFTATNMISDYNYTQPQEQPQEQPPEQPQEQPQPQEQSVMQSNPKYINNYFTPYQADKLFWCFYIILKGYEEYEMNRSLSFSIEKQLKIETVEKLKYIKPKLKEMKLKRTELEDELVNKKYITIKGLCALCLVHNVSIIYIYGRKYCEINMQNSIENSIENSMEVPVKTGIICQNTKKENSLKWTSNEINKIDHDFLNKIKKEYWLIENIQKPLNAPSYYTLKELYIICEKLQIETHVKINEKTKSKPKTKLYEEIIQQL